MDAKTTVCNKIMLKTGKTASEDKELLMSKVSLKLEWQDSEQAMHKLTNAIELAQMGYDVSEFYIINL